MDTFTLIRCVLAAVVLSSFLSRFLPKISTRMKSTNRRFSSR